MSIYSINGYPLQSVYDINGDSLSQCYDINGNELMGELPTFLDSAMITNIYTSSITAQPQGGCIDDDGNIYVCFYHEGKFRKYNLNTGTLAEVSFTPDAYGHANGMTYNPNTGYLYLASMNSTGEVFVFDKSFNLVDTLYAKDGNNAVFNCWNIAYNRNTEKFITISSVNGGVIYFMDNDFNYVRSITFDSSEWANTRQDIETDGQFIYGLSYDSNHIYVFDFSGNLVKDISNTAFLGEPESMCYDWINDRYYIEGKSSYFVIREAIFKDVPDLTVMTYNVQWFTGIISQLTMQQSIINNHNANIIGVQEISTNGTVPSVGQTVFSSYQYQQLSNHKNYIAMMSKFPLSNVVVADFENQDPNDMTQYSETRAYMMADISIGGKTITWINTHLCLTAEYKYLQMKEIFDIMETKEYAIATGDFNISAYDYVSGLEYINMIKQFADAGYNVANNKATGHTNTHTSATTASSLADLTKPHDDIITTWNIDILNVMFDTTKFNYLNGNPIDHIPVIATLKIN